MLDITEPVVIMLGNDLYDLPAQYDITSPVNQLLGYGLVTSDSAALTAESSVTATMVLVADANASLSAESSLVSAIIIEELASSSLSGETDLVSAASLVATAAATLSAESDLSAGIRQVWQGAAVMSAELSLTVAANIVTLAISLANGGSSLAANATAVRTTTARNIDLNVIGLFTARIVYPCTARQMAGSSNLQATVYIPSKYLVLPTIEVAYTDNVLLERYPIDNGQSLLITSNIGTLTTFPAQEEIADADYYFRGGSTNILNDEELAAVEAAGYGEYVVTQ
jgi:hypothetical protein